MLAALLSTLAVATTVEIAPTPLAASLTALLTDELPAGAIVEDDGALVVQLARDGGTLTLEIRDADGRVRLARGIDTADGERPALRVAALLVVEIFEQPAPPPPPTRTATVTRTATIAARAPPSPPPLVDLGPPPAPVEVVTPPPPAAPSVRSWWFFGGAAGAWWTQPSTPQVGVYLGARYDFGPLEAGVRLGAQGLCCALAIDGRVDGDALQFFGLAEASLEVVDTGAFAVAPVLAAGVQVDRVTARATAFVGEPIEETLSATGVLGRAGLIGRWTFSAALGVELGAGIALRTPRFVSRLPPAFATDSDDLDAGVLSPWLELGVRGAPF